MTIGQLAFGAGVTLVGLCVVCVLSVIVAMAIKPEGDE